MGQKYLWDFWALYVTALWRIYLSKKIDNLKDKKLPFYIDFLFVSTCTSSASCQKRSTARRSACTILLWNHKVVELSDVDQAVPIVQNNILFLFALDDCTQMYQPMFSLKCIILFHTQLLDSRGFDIQLDSNCRANWKYCLCLLSVPLEYF